MPEDIETIVLDKIRTSEQFCLQLDEYRTQILVKTLIVRFVELDGDVTGEKLPFFASL